MGLSPEIKSAPRWATNAGFAVEQRRRRRSPSTSCTPDIKAGVVHEFNLVHRARGLGPLTVAAFNEQHEFAVRRSRFRGLRLVRSQNCAPSDRRRSRHASSRPVVGGAQPRARQHRRIVKTLAACSAADPAARSRFAVGARCDALGRHARPGSALTPAPADRRGQRHQAGSATPTRRTCHESALRFDVRATISPPVNH